MSSGLRWNQEDLDAYNKRRSDTTLTGKEPRTPRVKGYRPTTVDGIRFDSKRESERYLELLLLERAGAIRRIKVHKRYKLIIRDVPILTETGRVMQYECDFEYLDLETGETIIEDVKGHKTDTYKVKKAIMQAMGLKIQEV